MAEAALKAAYDTDARWNSSNMGEQILVLTNISISAGVRNFDTGCYNAPYEMIALI